MKTALIYSDDFAKYDYGPGHPLMPFRLKLTIPGEERYGLGFGSSETRNIRERGRGKI